MTSIEGVGGPPPPRPGGRSAATGGPKFVLPGETPAAGAGAAAAVAGPAATTSMLSLQEFDSETVADREARRQAQDLLGELGKLQRALLSGADDPAALQRLADLAAAMPTATDRRLAALVSAIVLRVRVELARRHP